MYVSLICKCLLICFRNILVPFYSNESLKDEKIAQLRFILVPLMHGGSVIARNKYTKSFWKILTPPPPLVMALWKEIFLETGNRVRRSSFAYQATTVLLNLYSDRINNTMWIDACPENSKNFKISDRSQRVDTIKREMFSQKSVRRFVGDSSAVVMGAMFLASALNRGISPRY